jgi:hypothetical protein
MQLASLVLKRSFRFWFRIQKKISYQTTCRTSRRIGQDDTLSNFTAMQFVKTCTLSGLWSDFGLAKQTKFVFGNKLWRHNGRHMCTTARLLVRTCGCMDVHLSTRLAAGKQVAD